MTTHPETAQPSAAATAAATGTRRKAARADDDARTPATGSSAAAAARAPATAPLPPGCAAAACAGADDTAAEGEPVLARPHAASACPPLQEPGRSTTPAAPPPELECLRAHASLPRPPIACPAGYCKARFDGRDPHRSLRRHIKYVVDQGPGKSLHYTDHVELYQRTKAEAGMLIRPPAPSARQLTAPQRPRRRSRRPRRSATARAIARPGPTRRAGPP